MPIAKVNGIDLYYEVHGSGEPLLLIAGTGSDHNLLSNQTQAFAKEFQCIVVDNRGTGRSSKPKSGYSAQIMADDVAGLLSSLGVSSAHVAGHSLGASIGQEIAINYPELVKTLSLYSSWDRPYPHFRRKFEIQAELVKWGNRDVLGSFVVMTTFGADYMNVHEDQVKVFEQRAHTFDDSEETGTPTHALLGHYAADISHDTTGRLGKITAPTLILVGAQDPLTRPEYSRSMHKEISNSELVVLDDADHMAPIFKPDEFNAVALRFLRKHIS